MTEFFTDLMNQLSTLNAGYIYLFILIISYLENVFPPIPGDVLIVFAGYLIGLEVINFPEALLYSTIGSILGFIHVYGIGRWLGDSIMSEHRMKFLPKERIREVSRKFGIYGYWLIISNRFLAGTRAVISLFAGIARLSILKTTIFAVISALVWNLILLYLGRLLGENWQTVSSYLESYALIVTSLIVLVITILIIRKIVKRKSE